MAMQDDDQKTTRLSEWLALAGASALLVALLASAVSCGDEDLIFPGMVPFTPTSVNTATPTPSS
jgi:hypothetical protein